jgi:hypothetical protein
MKIVENQQWVEENFGDAQLKDKRRTTRLLSVATNLLDAPEQSLPKQNEIWAELKAAYRLFDSPAVTFEAIATPHWEKTRAGATGRCLCISDTTELDYTDHPETTGLAQIGNGGGSGMLLHSCLVYDCETGQVGGTAGARIHYRKNVSKKETRTQRLNRIRESSLWGQVVDDVGTCPEDAQWIHVFDRGGDNFEAMCHIVKKDCDFVIRAAQLSRKVIAKDGTEVSLTEAITSEDVKVLGSYELNLRSRPGVKARAAKIQVSSVAVRYVRPKLSSAWVKKSGVDEIQTNVVIVEEVGAPKSVTPIKWVLLTSLRASTFAAAWQVIEDYEHRWLIEEYHKVLKTGCKIESRQLRAADRLEAVIAITTVVGTRLLAMKYIGRNQPDARAATHVPSSWLRCLKLVRPKTKLTNMTVYTFFRELAKLGGFLGRKGDGEPGWETTWHGYQKLQTLLAGMRLVTEI